MFADSSYIKVAGRNVILASFLFASVGMAQRLALHSKNSSPPNLGLAAERGAIGAAADVNLSLSGRPTANDTDDSKPEPPRPMGELAVGKTITETLSGGEAHA